VHDHQRTLGIADTLPPLALHDVWGRLWLGATGLLLVLLCLYPALMPAPWGGLLVLACWIALPLLSIIKAFARRPLPADVLGRRTEVTLYTSMVVAFGVAFTLWARHLGLSWQLVISVLFFIESLPSAIVSFTEWWRLSNLGFSAGLLLCGFGLPFVHRRNQGVLVGGSVVVGSTLSALILAWQLRRRASRPTRHFHPLHVPVVDGPDPERRTETRLGPDCR
jgi:hypothetical protein